MKIHLVLAPNPGLFTGPGTNTWLVESEGEVVVIDPGPAIASHVEAVENACAGLTPVAVLVTHTHPDHAPAANRMARDLAVPAYGYSDGPEFVAERTLIDGQHVTVGGTRLMVIHTPGHTADSVCLRAGDSLFSGDHVMGGSTVVIEHMADYLASLRRLQGVGLRSIYPGHGPVIDDPDAVVGYYIEHRLEREQQIIGAVKDGAGTVGDVVTSVYHDVDPSLHPAAAMSVAAHIDKLIEDGVLSLPAGAAEWGSPVALAGVDQEEPA